ncbi:MAG: pyruvate, phosphate dikinase [Waddliaceae bacterium]
MSTTRNQQQEKTRTRYVYAYGKDVVSPPLDVSLLGGKGKGLAEMASMGLPVPPGFIISTEACKEYRSRNDVLFDALKKDICAGMEELEKRTGKGFGSETNPLLVSVRSGARVSMPGMMDTILNLGLNDQTLDASIELTKNERFAYDNYRRLIMMYANIVDNVSRKHFEQAFEILKMREGVLDDRELSLSGMKEASYLFKKIFEKETGHHFPQDVNTQLFEAISAVFDSWDSERATLYRQLHYYPDDWGTAVNVVAMVFGNKNQKSATGVGFTRDPSTGANHFFGEFLIHAQGEEVVAGIRTPHPLNEYQKEITHSPMESLEMLMPDVYQELLSVVHRLEHHYKDMQDIEFTIEDGRLFMLQTRTGKRTGFAAVRIAVEMLEEKLIDEKTALKRIQPEQLGQLLAQVFDQKAKEKAIDRMVAKGINAGPGAAAGKAVFSSEKAVEMNKQSQPCILVREEANPDDFPGMVASEGVLTIRGGSTSHAAVVARGLGKPCVVGCENLTLNMDAKTLTANGISIREGDSISIDGQTGEVFFCTIPTCPSEIVQVLLNQTKKAEDSLIFQHYQKIMTLADKYRTLKIRTNADTPEDSAVARAFGAEGIGLCRTEHMFMEFDRLNDVRCMFFSTRPEERKHSIDRLLPYQKEDFIGIFRRMNGLPVCIRLLDPPLHEFMPHSDEELRSLSHLMGISLEKLSEIRLSLEERNPMLGHRGCRLGIVYPELTEMQTRAILEAALKVSDEGVSVFPEIMVPLVGTYEEFVHQLALIEKTAGEVFRAAGREIPFTTGTMIELPRAALIADEIAGKAEFFSFGTNDLTQTTFGISRDDSAKFVPLYVKGVPHPQFPNETLRLLSADPFQVIDRKGVGKLMEIAIQKGRQVRPDLKCGICGEHGGETQSVHFCQEIGLDYVSCSPFRISVARLAAALANL